MVYMLTFPPIGTGRHQARFYIGYCADDRDPYDRLAEHRAGRGAAITRAVVRVHGPDALLLLWALPGDRRLERRLKRQRNHKRFVTPERVIRLHERR